MSRYDFGAVCAGDIATANFRLRNTASGRATITLLSVAGAGLTLSPKPALPLTLTAQGSADFTVAFQGSSTGGYSAALSTDGRSVLLTAAASGNQPLAASPADFGPVQVGQAQTLHVLVSNRMQQTLDVPPSQRGDKRFRLLGPAPSGTSLQPGETSVVRRAIYADCRGYTHGKPCDRSQGIHAHRDRSGAANAETAVHRHLPTRAERPTKAPWPWPSTGRPRRPLVALLGCNFCLLSQWRQIRLFNLRQADRQLLSPSLQGIFKVPSVRGE